MRASAYDPLNEMNKLSFCWCVATNRTPALDVFSIYAIRLYKQPSVGEVLANPPKHTSGCPWMYHDENWPKEGVGRPLLWWQRENKFAGVHFQRRGFRWQQWASPSGVGRPHSGALDSPASFASSTTAFLTGLPLLHPLCYFIFIFTFYLLS